VASTENAAAIGGSVLSFLFPVVLAVLILILVVWVLSKLGKQWARLRR
jgi:flagellar biogenesis protein FliO